MFLGFLVDGFQKVGRVDAVDERDVRDNVFDFIGLQVANEVPSDVLRQYFVFVAHLLGVVLSKGTLTCIVGFL